MQSRLVFGKGCGNCIARSLLFGKPQAAALCAASFIPAGLAGIVCVFDRAQTGQPAEALSERRRFGREDM